MKAEWFGGRLRELREAKGLTQKELAERTGVTKDGIAKLERGERGPTWETVIALCQTLDVDVGQFAKQPAERPEPQRGRPPRAKEESRPPTPKRTRGRPRKTS